ncbi:hypothetical protein A3J78_00075 [Candidatus Beckwithbacteria bacterium RBG_13_35_6]|uniref:Ribbon-helix-helix protein CopG domain-containing protein n=1 Tax=Candidatus Beckwithbacteria bacterium RBG_13_35_6 TaxID=1797456 RepID=A0A1F5DH13_9BACT|nr:MAG: hypothetical protein A3J78_00075 [Candidatus Beckwithbacteria bacterium RBG_13_35_6]
MTQTINISLPKQLFDQIRTQVNEGGYVSISEFIRESVRNLLKASTAFSTQAEEEILKISKTKINKDKKFDSEKTTVAEMFNKLENK